MTENNLNDTNIFTQKRSEDDEDLVAWMREQFLEQGLAANIACYDNYSTIKEAKDLIPEAQRFLINKYLRLLLMSSSEDTQTQRFYLIDTGEISSWKDCILKGVLPAIVEQGLLKPI